VLNKRFGMIIFQLRFDTVKINWIKTNAYKKLQERYNWEN